MSFRQKVAMYIVPGDGILAPSVGVKRVAAAVMGEDNIIDVEFADGTHQQYHALDTVEVYV